ncbi:carbohydrate ABC transporter permease [Rugosimonospora africana]|uniref:carbohydrate ABC transporter permease n=1 Tax=Rugosimonospora africana TaxID=556532 RepID=UPI001942530C|nr:sugar ABC transporter permease [Rugosimonospora africana]
MTRTESAATPPALGAARSARRPSPATDVVGLGRSRAVAFVAPALVLIGVFLVFPAFWTLYIGVTNYRLTGAAAKAPEVVGLDNYRGVLSDPAFYRSLWLTLIYVLVSAAVGQNVLGFGLAWALRGARRAIRRLIESLVLLAWVLPSSVVAFLWIAMLDRDAGTVNMLLGQSPGTAWLVQYPMTALVVFNIWRGTAFSMMLYSAALSSVPPSHLETARVVGSSTMQTLRDVVLPHIRRHALTNTLLITLWTFNDFTPFLLTAGGPDHRSEVAPVYIYNTAIVGGDMGYSGAVSLVVLLINLLLALVYLRAARAGRSS